MKKNYASFLALSLILLNFLLFWFYKEYDSKIYFQSKCGWSRNTGSEGSVLYSNEFCYTFKRIVKQNDDYYTQLSKALQQEY